MTLLPCLGRSIPGSRPLRVVYLGTQVRQTCTSQVPCATVLALQIDKAVGWDYYLDTAGRSSICQYSQSWLFQTPPPPSALQLDTQWWSPTDSPQSSGGETRVGAPKKLPTMLWKLDVHPGLSSLTGRSTGSRETYGVLLCRLGGRGNVVSV